MPKSEQGISFDRYAVIPRTLIFITCGRHVLLLKGAKHKRLWAGMYNGIGGHIERGEDVLSAAKRELKEEAGLDGVLLHLAGTVFIDVACQRGIALFVFRGEYTGGELRESGEGSLEWVDVSHLDEYPLVEDLVTILPRVLENGEPFSALYYYDSDDKMRIRFGGDH